MPEGRQEGNYSPPEKKMKGGGLLDKVLDEGKIFGVELPELHLRGFTGKYNFCGPGTKLKKRLDDYGRPLPGSRPINSVDNVCMQHDIDYELGVPKKEADKRMIERLDRIKSKNWREKFDKALVRTAIKGKMLLGLGKRKK